jgi:hypothetical protein
LSGIQIEPSYQEYVVTTDDSFVKGSAKISNTTNESVTLKIFALDIRQANEKGEISFVDKPLSGEAFTLATFLDPEKKSIELKKGESQEVPFTVRNSPDLSPGGHYGAIIAQYAETNEKGKQQVLPALSSIVLVRKTGGERYNISLVSLEKEAKGVRFSMPSKYLLTFANEGNVHSVPRGLIEFKDTFGRVTHRGLINDGSLFVLPQVRRQIPVTMKQIRIPWPLMFYTITIKGTTDVGEVPFQQSTSFIYFNWVVITGILVLLGCIIYFVRKWIHFLKKGAHEKKI